jgi:molecular chaperone DnaK
MSKTINVWIDLWTTNSAIVINIKWTFEVIKVDGVEYMPSVFGFDPAGNPRVGIKAYDKLFQTPSLKDIRNYKAEIKRLMGSQDTVFFDAIQKSLTPEEISAEILKNLKSSVSIKYPDYELNSVVITVPAHFSTLQSEATKRAGELAWFKYVILLQEPIAAAISYGFSNSENENWLVYDLWGWTFDVAVISLKDWILNVRSHNWDNFLWWKDLDWAIVENMILPKILEKYNLSDFTRNNKRVSHIFNKLKWLSEQAKKELSRDEKTTIFLENLWEDDDWKEIEMNIDITRNELEKIIEPLISKTITLSKRTIEESWLENSKINRVILVWWPTQIPYIRIRLKQELNILIDSSVDPLTVVARGACIYWASQIIPENISFESSKPIDKSLVSINLQYDSMTADDEQLVVGFIEALKEDTDNYYIQFQSEDGLYVGSKIKVKNWKFIENIRIQTNKSNLYFIYLFDDKGNIIWTNPDNLQIIHWISLAGSPLPHSVGVAITKANFSILEETMDFYFNKWIKLPLKKNKMYRTQRDVKKGDPINILPIKVYEGESINPVRNTYICDLKVTWKDILFDLPKWTEIEVTLEINESRELKVSVYLPLMDLYLSTSKLRTEKDETVDPDRLLGDIETERQRFDKIKSVIDEKNKEEMEKSFSDIESQLNDASTDLDTVKKSQHEFKELQQRMDNLEKSGEFDAWVLEFNNYLESIPELMGETELSEEDKDKYNEKLVKLRNEWNSNINAKDKELLKNTNNNLSDLETEILVQNPSFWMYRLRNLQENKFTLNFSNPERAEILMQKWEDFINQWNIPWLISVVRELWQLLPKEQQRINNMSWIIK